MMITVSIETACCHCGDPCKTGLVLRGEKTFCCEGCRTVYELLDQSGLCDYYQLNEKPGIPRSNPSHKDKFAFLDDEKIAARFITFRNDREVHARFYLPQIHCSSCLFLLESLHRLDPGVIHSRVGFAAKEVSIVYNPGKITIRQLADLLSATGYDPSISLRDLGNTQPPTSRGGIYRLGIAGFCFANIMLLSFPEYLGLGVSEHTLRSLFRTLNLILAVPVFFYSAQPFYRTAWKGLQHRFLNIDAPIVLAIWVTFVRSVVEVISGTGAGYFDSMSGIVFFMLAGRMLQDRTQERLSFERDYTSYFPIAVGVLRDGKETPRPLPEIQTGDTLVIPHGALIPADGLLTRGKALIDYSFVTGESLPVPKEIGELVYAGGRQTGPSIEVLVVKEVAQSYLTQLWNRQSDKKEEHSIIHGLSRRFTYIVFAIAASAALYWWVHNPSRIASAVTAVLIVACPCALLLSSTFTNGNILRILGNNGLYLRNARVIENIASTTSIVFDKTGTLTLPGTQEPVYTGAPLTIGQKLAIVRLASHSMHPLSKALTRHLSDSILPDGNLSGADLRLELTGFKEFPGKGIRGLIGGNTAGSQRVVCQTIALGSEFFVRGEPIEHPIGFEAADPPNGAVQPGQPPLTGSRQTDTGARVFVSFDGIVFGSFSFPHRYRPYLDRLTQSLSPDFKLSVLSGDNALDQGRLRELMGSSVQLRFNQKPFDKTHFIRNLQDKGEKVMMIGDGLNDAGALKQSDTGIALTENDNNFTPASHAILDGGQLQRLPQFIRFCRLGGKIILTSFLLSICYNLAGLSFAVSGDLSPVIAAILMPASSLSILLVTYGLVNAAARYLGLRRNSTRG